MSESRRLVDKLWSYCNVLRDDGVGVVKTNYLTYFRVSRGAATYDDSQLPFNLDSN